MGGKEELQVESRRVASKPIQNVELDTGAGTLRVQKDNDVNQVHVHGENGMRFCFDGIDRFLDLWDIFWKNAPAMAAKRKPRKVVFRGKSKDLGKNRQASDLVFEFEDGEWVPSLEFCMASQDQVYEMTSVDMVKINYFLKYGTK